MAWFSKILTKISGVQLDDPLGNAPSVSCATSLAYHAAVATKNTHSASLPVPKRKKADASSYISHLDAPLVRLSKDDNWTLRDACSATHIFGGNGSGKTSGSGQTLAKSFLRARFGGVVLCAKHDECETWLRYAKETGREGHVIVVSPEQPWRFNFIEYELERNAHDPARAVENLLTTFLNIMDQSTPNQGGSGDSEFWKEAAGNLLRNLLLLASAAIPNFTIADLRKLVSTAPHKRVELSDDIASRGSFGATLAKARSVYEKAGMLPDFDAMAHYWLYDFPSMPENTRGSVTFTLTTMLQHLQTGTLRELFSTGSNFFPEDTHEGALIILNLPVTGNQSNRMAQILFKVIWQFAALRRMEHITKHTRPIFLWSDEAHFFVTPSDTDFQSLARGARACSVYMTQNITSYEQRFGDATTQAFLGYFQTLIFHAQSNVATNELAQKLFGKVIKNRGSVNSSTSLSASWGESFQEGSGVSNNTSFSNQGYSFSYGSNYNITKGTNVGTSKQKTKGRGSQETLEEALQYGDLTSIKNGTPINDYKVGCYIFNTGRTWIATGTNCLYTEFDQRS